MFSVWSVFRGFQTKLKLQTFAAVWEWEGQRVQWITDNQASVMGHILPACMWILFTCTVDDSVCYKLVGRAAPCTPQLITLFYFTCVFVHTCRSNSKTGCKLYKMILKMNKNFQKWLCYNGYDHSWSDFHSCIQTNATNAKFSSTVDTFLQMHCLFLTLWINSNHLLHRGD